MGSEWRVVKHHALPDTRFRNPNSGFRISVTRTIESRSFVAQAPPLGFASLGTAGDRRGKQDDRKKNKPPRRFYVRLPCSVQPSLRDSIRKPESFPGFHPGLFSTALAGLNANKPLSRTSPRHKRRVVATRLVRPFQGRFRIASDSGGVAPGYPLLPFQGNGRGKPTAQSAVATFLLTRFLRRGGARRGPPRHSHS